MGVENFHHVLSFSDLFYSPLVIFASFNVPVEPKSSLLDLETGLWCSLKGSHVKDTMITKFGQLSKISLILHCRQNLQTV